MPLKGQISAAINSKRPLRELGWQRDYRGQVRSHFFGKWEKLQNLPAPRRLPRDKRINPAAVFH
jgi:hypothetical protein